MDNVTKSESITTFSKIKEQDFLTDNSVTSRKISIDISQIEKELSNSLKLLESGLSNLEIEAAHFLDSGEFKNSFSLNNKYLSSNFDKQGTVQVIHKTPKNFSNVKKNSNSHLSHSSGVSETKVSSIPPDLTFSFYSSTDEIIIPLKSQYYQTQKSESTKKSNDELQSSLDEILRNTAEQVLTTKTNFETQLKNGADGENLVKQKSDVKKEKTDELNKNNEIVSEMNDLMESLSKIQTALNDLDKEAAHILNPKY